MKSSVEKQGQGVPVAGRDRSLLPWIVAFKAIKAIALTALGIALLALRRSDPFDAAMRAAMTFHLPLTSRLLTRAVAYLSALTIRKETALAITAFAYAALMGTEGIALYLRKPWARWFTIIATSSLIPVEVYEIVRDVRPARVAILVVNILVLVYLWEMRTD